MWQHFSLHHTHNFKSPLSPIIVRNLSGKRISFDGDRVVLNNFSEWKCLQFDNLNEGLSWVNIKHISPLPSCLQKLHSELEFYQILVFYLKLYLYNSLPNYAKWTHIFLSKSPPHIIEDRQNRVKLQNYISSPSESAVLNSRFTVSICRAISSATLQPEILARGEYENFPEF